MSSVYSQREECGDSGGWRGPRQGGNRGRGGRSSGPGSSYSGGRSEVNHSTVEEHWNDEEDSYQGPDQVKSNTRKRDWEDSKGSRGRGFGDHQTRYNTYGGGDQRGVGRGHVFNDNNKSEGDDDNGTSGWDDGTDKSGGESSYQQGGSKFRNDGFADDQDWEGGINKLNIRDSGSGRGRGHSNKNSYQNQERNSFGGGDDDWGDNKVRGRRDYEEEGDRRSNRGRGGFRGGGHGFRSSRNDEDGNGEYNDASGEHEARTNRVRGGGRFGSREDVNQGGGGRRGRGYRDSRNDEPRNGEYNDSWGENESGSYRGRGGGRFGSRDDLNQGEGGYRGRGGRGGGSGRGFGQRGHDDDNEDRFGGARGNKEEGEEDKPRERYIPPAPADDEETVFGSTISTGNNFNSYDNIPVKVSGDNVPKPINSFEECNFKDLLLQNIIKSGYTRPTPVQKHAIPAIAGGRDVMGCAQTGSGKTAAFLLPIIQVLLNDKIDLITGEWVEPQVVICSPTRELAQQIFNEARKFAYGSIIKVAIAYGGTAPYYQASQIAKGCHILVATPGRLNDFVGRGRVKFTSCRFFVLDEADRMLDMGFLPAIEKMLDHETMTPKGQRQTLMFSATFPDDIQRLASNYLYEYLFLAVGIVGGACADVEQNFYLVPRFDKKDKLIEVLSEGKDKELTLVFVEKQRTADFIAAFLSENNFPTTSIHGARLQSQREQALADFKCGRMPTLVATAVAARGLDIKNVMHVVNFDMPSSIEEYVHRIGRTGRVGNRGKATSFYDPDVDGQLIKGLIRILQQSEQVIPSFFDGANDLPSFRGGRRSQNFGGQDVRGGEDNVFNSGPAVVHEEEEEGW